ncbi:MAG: archaellin/type IV pilin N-terminal domain-containing protein [Nanoarchaeota archaeon]
MNKKGLSPAIATALLISLALVLAALIFIWASSLLKEKNQKFGEPIENACDDINFAAEAYGGQLHIVNRGKVPIQSFEIKKKTAGSVESLGIIEGTKTLIEGESDAFTLDSVSAGDEILATPIIYGKQKGQRAPHVCDKAELNIKVEA